jgi:LETM1 and EF-hand domain-containing protein 1
MISAEGVDSLTIPELVQACQSRGIRFYGVSPAVMRSELTQWIELHLKHEIPSSLLILSRAFILSERPLKEDQALKGSTDALKAALSSLPHQLINEAQLKVSEAQGVATYKQKLDVLKEQEELIEDELEQEATQTARAIEKKEQEVAVKKANEELSKASVSEKEAEVTDTENQIPITASVPGVKHEMLEDSATAPVDQEKVADKDFELSQEELFKLREALKSMTKESALSDVKEKLADLKVKQAARYSVKLGKKVDKMISKIEKELSKYDVEIGSKLNILRPNEEGNVTINELEEAMKVIQQFPNDERIKMIVKKLDADGDGYVALQSLLELVEDCKIVQLINS